MKIVFFGDIVGAPARELLKEKLSSFVKQEKIDFALANAENAASGSGLTKKVVEELFSAGLDCITLGDHSFRKKDILAFIENYKIIRPYNWSKHAPGKGFDILEKNGKKLAVVNLIGRVFMDPYESPFDYALDALEKISSQTKNIIVDMHAEATSEKVAMSFFLSKKVSAVVGTHTHVPTADERILDGHTGAITDVGMCGSFDSVLGRDKDNVLKFFSTNMPAKFDVSDKDVRLNAVIIELDETDGKCLNIQRKVIFK